MDWNGVNFHERAFIHEWCVCLFSFVRGGGNSVWNCGHLWSNCKAHWLREKCTAGSQSIISCWILWYLSLSSGRQSCWAHCTGVAGAGNAADSGGMHHEGQYPCGSKVQWMEYLRQKIGYTMRFHLNVSDHAYLSRKIRETSSSIWIREPRSII